ncbi:MAG: hypothetical protein QGF00_30375, partial [Planctomycetota bacterium]|nr:hypothetical protein [Planctomycetota bacterium]
ADCDTDQKNILKSAGFNEEARLRNRLRSADGWMDLMVYTVILPDNPPPLSPQETYYGSRQNWQSERVSSCPDRKLPAAE